MRHRKLMAVVMTLVLVSSAGWLGAYYRGTGSRMTAGAQAFLGSLNATQRASAQLEFNSPERLKWHFIPIKTRKGVPLREMTPAQRKLAHALLHSSLGEIGFEKTMAIMSLEAILHELEGDRRRFDREPDKYYFTVFGNPAMTGSWGLSIEGHHLSLNFVVKDGAVVSATPAFFGTNPATVQQNGGVGLSKGTRTLASEEQIAFDLVASLNADQRKQAVLSDKAPSDIRAAGDAQPPTDGPVGMSVTAMTAEQKNELWELLEVYAANMPVEVGKTWLDQIDKAGRDKVHFAWEGALKPGIGHYYRIQGPTFLVEFCNVQSDPAGNKANHVHAVWRNMAGDFGIKI